jgi:hypothetical protein
MKKTIFFLFVALIGLSVNGQSQAESFIKEAQDFLAKKEYKQAQLSLQDAINDINMLVAQQVAGLLPAEIDGLKTDGDSQVSAAGMGMMGGGMQITKRYRNETKPDNDAEVQIIANSPMIATMSMYLTNPAMLGSGYKSVRVGTTRAILKTDLQDGENDAKIRSTEIQIPMGQTMITIQANGFATEQDELSFANKLELEKIRAALGE